MLPVDWICKTLAGAAHSVVAEYRKLDAPPAPPAAAEPARQELSCTQARVESAWRQTQRSPADARAFGFGQPPEQ
ncbi:MAG TPA: hypothetical protein VK586_06545 [Streptosporangiaceae bacterium]|nr:hypothetical protein [Streptosporangiaceae bacterium]